MDNKKYLNLFPAPILMTELELNIDSLIEFCYEMKHKNEKGVEITNVGGWHSEDIINETHTEFVKLKNKIEENANTYHHEIQFKKTYIQKINKIWININQKGHSNNYHDHPFACLSGAFYLTKSKIPIVFGHPFRDITTYFWDVSMIEEWNEANSGQWLIEPEPNKLLIFPSWLQHKVSMNKEDIDRISLSFNTIFK
jgi:uncharacterized protein (TIGR02466 family)